MAQAVKKRSVRGEGECGNPYCSEPKAPDRFLCASHASDMDRIRHELENDPRLLYHKRSDNKNRTMVEPKTKKISVGTCKSIGCFELIPKGETYCYAHSDQGGHDGD